MTVTHDMSHVTIADVRRVSERFVGDIEQIPPMVSAIKIDGKRLHELARQGKTVERKPRPVTVYELTIDEVPDEPNIFRFTTRCSSGTYVRTIAADIGAALGGGRAPALASSTAIGSFVEAGAAPLEKAPLLSLADGLRDYGTVTLDEETVVRVRHGQPLRRGPAPWRGPWVLLDPAGDLVAVQ